jgi:hypothetical protein
MNEVEKTIWAAGFLDGEGCFALVRQSNKRSHDSTRSPVVHAAQIRKAPLERLVAVFGGTVRVMRVTDAGKVVYQWSLTGPKVIPVIEAVLPYLCGKQEEAQAVLDYARTVGRKGRSKFESQRPLYRSHRMAIIRRHERARMSS